MGERFGLPTQAPVDEPVLKPWIESSPQEGPDLFICQIKVLNQSEVLIPTGAQGSPGETTCSLSLAPSKTSCQDLKMSSVQSVTQSCLTLCDPMNRSTPGLPVHHQLLEIIQTHVH